MKAVNAGLVTFYYWTARSYYFYTLSATPSAGDVLYDSPNIQDDSGERVTSYNEGELYITHFTWAFTHDSSGDVGKGKIKAVAEPVSINYYGWMGSGYLTMYTTSDTPSVGDNAYSLPNPSAVVGTITQATINNITVNGTTVDRQNYLDTTYTGNIYKLINQ